MSEISAAASFEPNLNSLAEELVRNIQTDASIQSVVDSSTSVDELSDKLNILESINRGQGMPLVAAIKRMVQNDMPLEDIKKNICSI
jgi:YesN/AraC family two-component response regulator